MSKIVIMLRLSPNNKIEYIQNQLNERSKHAQ